MNKPFNILWLQSGGCGGCSMSLLCAESPDLMATLEGANIHLLWHPAFSEACGAELLDLFESIINSETQLDALCLEGSAMRGPGGTGQFHMLAGTNRPMMHWLQDLSRHARYTLAMGSCAAFGGVTAAGNNPADACGLQYEGIYPGGILGEDYLSTAGFPVINVAGCPTHPNWVTETLMLLAEGQISHDDIDHYHRPRTYADHLVHHGCPRNEYYEFKASAQKSSDLGCLMEHLGCLGTQAHADCNTRLWNGDGSCLRGGYACINCTVPEFEEPGRAFGKTSKIAGIPIGLPADMPRAWFVALASLSKAATPKRLKENAASDHIVVSPSMHGRTTHKK